MSWWYQDDSKLNAASQKKADERRALEAQANAEWEEAWGKANEHARQVNAERKRQFEESQKPAPSADENLAAIRKLLEAQEAHNNG